MPGLCFNNYPAPSKTNGVLKSTYIFSGNTGLYYPTKGGKYDDEQPDLKPIAMDRPVAAMEAGWAAVLLVLNYDLSLAKEVARKLSAFTYLHCEND
jgi:hypothetical protein